MDRRSFLRIAGAAALAPAAGTILGACGGDDKATATDTGSAPSGAAGPLEKVKLGFIALTDCAPLILAKELGIFEQRGLDVTIEKQASWPATRDNLLNGQIDGAHCLYSMPLSVATSIGGAGGTALKIAMGLDQNGQGITLASEFASVGYGDLEAAGQLLNSKDAPTLGMTFPGGTHDTWLRYWVKAAGVDSTKLQINAIPPPQMVQNMSVNAVQGYCVGEPWNAVAVQQDIGFTHLATQDIWDFHPEKALVVNERFASQRKDVLKQVMGGVLEACKWLDDLDNRSQAADTLGAEKYVNASPDEIRGRLIGKYDLGAGIGEKDFAGHQMQFFRDGLVNLPRKSYGIWWLAQFQRFGYLKEAPPYQELVDSIFLTDLYHEVADAEGVTIPDDDMKPFEVKLDGVEFDPAKPEKEASRS